MSESVETLKSKRRTAKNQRSTFKNRRDAVKKAYDNSFKMDDYYSKIKKKTDNCADDLKDGLKGIGGSLTSKCNNIKNSDEHQVLSSQYPFNNAISDMSSEYWRCDNEVNMLNTKIKIYERKIREQGGVLMPWE